MKTITIHTGAHMTQRDLTLLVADLEEFIHDDLGYDDASISISDADV